MTQKSDRIPILDGLRGIAALAVVVFHLTGQTTLGTFPPRAYLAVDFFFVLSGFVIARTYESRLASMSFWGFTRTRLNRLYPLIVLGALIGFAAKIVAYLHFSESGFQLPTVIVEALLFTLFLIPNKGMSDNGIMFELDSPLWSLMFEIWVNLIYAAVAPKLTTRVLAIVVALGAIALMVSAFIHGLHGGYTLATIGIGIARVWFSFFAGVLINRLPLRMPPIPAVILAGALVLSFVPSWGQWYEALIVLTVYPAIVALGVSVNMSPRCNSIAITAGALSYPIYVLHMPAIAHFNHSQNLSTQALGALLTSAILSVIVIGYAANRWYDEPIRRWLTRRSRRSVGSMKNAA